MKWTKEDFDREEDEGHNNICRSIISQQVDSADACCDSPSREKCEQCQETGLAHPHNH